MEVVALTEPPTLLTYTGWDDNQQKYLERIVVVVHLWEEAARAYFGRDGYPLAT